MLCHLCLPCAKQLPSGGINFEHSSRIAWVHWERSNFWRKLKQSNSYNRPKEKCLKIGKSVCFHFVFDDKNTWKFLEKSKSLSSCMLRSCFFLAPLSFQFVTGNIAIRAANPTTHLSVFYTIIRVLVGFRCLEWVPLNVKVGRTQRAYLDEE